MGISATADELRELAVTLKKIGITPAQCADGFGVATIMNRLGVIEDIMVGGVTHDVAY